LHVLDGSFLVVAMPMEHLEITEPIFSAQVQRDAVVDFHEIS
jgi:hypothetical protein